MTPRAFAVAAHPDDIEICMAGTVLLLGRAGYELHYMTLANGSCGTATLGRDEIVRIRTAEAQRAAEVLGAVYHPPLVDDLQIYYEPALLAKVAAVYRQVGPEILLLPSPQDYMEDHMNAARLMVTAAFAREMVNFVTDPPTPPAAGPVALYHCMPVGLCDPLRTPVLPDFFVDITDVLGRKRDALACHRSQDEWLDRSQGMSSYLRSMEDTAATVGRMSGRWRYAEGWRRHLHHGFAAEDFDPLCDALSEGITLREPGDAPWPAR